MFPRLLPALGVTLLALPAQGTVPAFSGAYCIEQYQETYENYHFWAHSLPGACTNIQHFQDTIDTAVKHTYSDSQVRRSLVKGFAPGSFDYYEIAYWQAHTVTLRVRTHWTDTNPTDWLYDPADLYNWGTSANAYLPGNWLTRNPEWQMSPCTAAVNPGPGYTAADSSARTTVAMPMWAGSYGRYEGEAVLPYCEFAYYYNDALGNSYLNWLVLDSCDSVRAASSDGNTAYTDAEKAWDQSFDGLHGVFGRYVPSDLAEYTGQRFATNLLGGYSIWGAWLYANLTGYSTANKRCSAITAEVNETSPYYKTLNEQWYGYGHTAADIRRLDIDYFWSVWYDPS